MRREMANNLRLARGCDFLHAASRKIAATNALECTMGNTVHPYDTLTPDVVLDALASVGIDGDGRLLAHAGFRFAVYPRRGGRAPELSDRATLEWVGRFIGRIHAVGATAAFADRPALDIASFGDEPRAFLLAGDFLPADLRDVWAGVSAQALDGVRRAFALAGDVRTLRLHGDCHAGNVLWTDDGPHFVDFDDCRTGPAVQDLWMLLAGSRAEMTRQLASVLDGYGDFFHFDRREVRW